MQFEWNEARNLENIRKHQIDIADVSAMFTEDMLIELDDRLDYGEDRSMGIGFLGLGVAVVVWTERQGDIIRISKSFQSQGVQPTEMINTVLRRYIEHNT